MGQLTGLATSESREQVVRVLHDIIGAWEQEELYCHPNAHHLGHFLFTVFDGDVSQALAHTDDTCGNALYHGVLENSLQAQKEAKNCSLDELDIATTGSNVDQSP